MSKKDNTINKDDSHMDDITTDNNVMNNLLKLFEVNSENDVYEKIQDLLKENEQYAKKIIDVDLNLKKLEDISKTQSLIINDYKEKIEKLTGDMDHVKKKSKEEYLSKLFGLIDTIKIVKNKIDSKDLKLILMLEKNVVKNLNVHNITMKEFNIGDNYNDFDDESKELCEVVTELADENMKNGQIKDIISNAFVLDGNILSFAKIFVVNNNIEE